MPTPPAEIQALLLRETLGLLASYSWQATVMLGPTGFGTSDVDLTLPEFFREFRLRHALATAARLEAIVEDIEVAPSHASGIERAETKGTIGGRLDTSRYIARRATLRSLPRPYPVIRSVWTHNTPENILARQALGQVHMAMRDNPFPLRSAESAAAAERLRWAARRISRRPWDDIPSHGLLQRLYNEVDARIRRRQTGNESAYSRLLRWLDQWTLDLHRLGSDDRNDLIRGFLAFPAGNAFWDKVFEVWCLLFVATTADHLGWTRIEGPASLRQADGVIYRYVMPSGSEVAIRFQRTEPLPKGRWSYRGAGALRGIPDVTIATATPGRPPLLIDAKNRFIRTDRISRSDEIYKMLGYAENFRPGAGQLSRFRGVLIFPSNRSAHRIVDGPEGGQLDLITVDLSGNRDPADAALADALTHWATVA